MAEDSALLALEQTLFPIGLWDRMRFCLCPKGMDGWGLLNIFKSILALRFPCVLIHIFLKLSKDMGPEIIHLLQMWKLRHREASVRPPFNAYQGRIPKPQRTLCPLVMLCLWYC